MKKKSGPASRIPEHHNFQDVTGCIESKSEEKSGIVIIGNRSVGKTSLFVQISNPDNSAKGAQDALPSAVRGHIRNSDIVIYDTPGTSSIFSGKREASVVKDLILPGVHGDNIGKIVVVGDAKNLRRSVALYLQFAEYGLPMLFILNMADEAAKNGIQINTQKLSGILNMPVCETVAREGKGLEDVLSKLETINIPEKKVTYTDTIETYLAIVEKMTGQGGISARAAGLLLLTGDEGIVKYLENKYSPEIVKQLIRLSEEVRKEGSEDPGVILSKLYMKKAGDIVREVQTLNKNHSERLIFKTGTWCMKPWPGIPIAICIVFVMYHFVGSFGATYLVDTINSNIFERFLIPQLSEAIEPVPWSFVKDMIADPDFGIFPTGVFLALGLVMPVLFCFYIAYGILEESGYLSRLAVLLDRVFRGIGLNGKGVIPLMMGFSCVTMAILTTRLLDTKKERNIASFLLLLGMPCAPLLAVMIIILDKMPISATFTIFGLIFLQILVAGYCANKLISGVKPPLILELQPMRLPRPWKVLKMSLVKTYIFIKEALPVFVLASVVVFIFDRAGGLAALEDVTKPLISGIMGLPEKSVQVFIKTIIRRESGATEIQHLSNMYDNVQLVVNLLVMTFLSPCINATIVLIKERGAKTAAAIMIAVMIYAVVIGSVVNHTCRIFGVSFT